jgi:superfamily II DNA or RNA helicase
MLHTGTVDSEVPPPSPFSTHVWCRARRWRALDTQRAGGTGVWRLALDHDVPRVIASPPDEVSAMRLRKRTVSRRAWIRDAIAHVHSHVPVWWPATATTLPVAALPWQFVPSMMMLSGHHRRVLLADAVGMGKTIQAALLLHEIHAREPDAATLVIAPATLVPQWVAELRTRVHLAPAVLDATALRHEAESPRSVVECARAGTCWLMSIDLLRQPDVVGLIARTRWTLLVVDEAHAAAPGTARLEAVSRVAGASVRVLLLTATPTACGTGDGLRRLGARPGEPPMPVVRRDAGLLSRPGRRSCTLHVDLEAGHASICARLDRFVERARVESGARGLLPALVLRRRAASCPAALRRSLERRLEVLGESGVEAQPVLSWLFDPDPLTNQDAQDDEVMRVGAWSDATAERRELEMLLGLVRQARAAGRKLECVVRVVRRCREPVVIFTAFLDTLRALRALLPTEGVVMVHGEQPEALRSHAIRSFTAGDAMVLLATDTAAEGLNLHARCRLVIHAEVPSSTRVLEQRNGRLDRYGQSQRVHAIVMSSRTREDRDAEDRLRARAQCDEKWMADAQVSRCRRSAVAARRLGFEIGQAQRVPGSTPPEGRDEPAICTCRLSPRRWRRLASRLGLPAGSTALWTATLRVTGGPPLSASRVPVLAVASDAATPHETAAPWREPLRGPIARAGRLARRLAGWERDASDAIETDASTHSMTDLFADGSRDRRVAPVVGRSNLSFTLEGEATIGLAGARATAASACGHR